MRCASCSISSVCSRSRASLPPCSSRARPAGANRVYLSGRVKGRAVRPGRWNMTVQAIGNNGLRSTVIRSITVRPRS